MRPRLVVTGMVLLAAAGCAEPLVFPDWSLPVEEGTRVVEYAPVPTEDRTATIDWVDELVIGDRGDTDPRYAFTRPSAVTVDARGQIYVVDPQAVSVKVFDASGEFLRELGREGQGPGEFQDPRTIVSLGDRVIVRASRNARWSHFDLDGNPVEDHAYPIYDNLEILKATDGGAIVGSTTRFTEEQVLVWSFGIYTPEAELVLPLFEMSTPNTPTIERNGRSTYFSRTPRAIPQAAVGRDGSAYWTMSDEYQLLAVGPDGAQRWALRVAVSPPALTREEIDGVMELVRGLYEDATESEVNLPDRQPALGYVLVDGHGHVYVFPYVWAAFGMPPNPPISVPVDVYSSEGERLFSGMTQSRRWAYADGDYVWEIGTDPATDENVVRKVRLVESFD